jgi:hypothetical protein
VWTSQFLVDNVKFIAKSNDIDEITHMWSGEMDVQELPTWKSKL